jgi:hypothetical protein
MIHFIHLRMSTYLLGADHAGFALKERLRLFLAKQRLRVEDLSPDAQDGDDYPDIAQRLAKHVAKHPDAQGNFWSADPVSVWKLPPTAFEVCAP